MTKLNSGKMIVIKINGERRSFEEEPITIEAESVDNNQPEGPEHALSFAKNDAHVEAAASKELSEESFDWILPESEPNQSDNSDFSQQQDEHLPINEKKRSSAIKPLILSVIFAVLLGTSLGIIMLKLVSTDQTKPSTSAIPSAPVSNKNGTQDPANVPAITLKSWTAYVVQGGVYSSKESVKSALSLAADSGVPASSIEMDGKQYILIGVANTMGEAKSLGSYLKEKGFADVYPRSLTIPEKNLPGLNTDAKAFIKDAAALFPILTQSTSNPMDSGSLTKETENRITELDTNIAKISSKKLNSGKMRNLKAEISAASKKVIAYQNNHDTKTLAEAQQHLLTFLAIYYSL